MAFRLRSRAGIDDLMLHIQGAASTQYVSGALYKTTNGLPVVLAGQTDQPFILIESMAIQPYNGQSQGNVNGLNTSPLRAGTELLTTTVGERVIGIPIDPSIDIVCDSVTPLLNRVAAEANTNRAQAICAYGGSTGDFTGGTVYLPDQDWQGVITASGVAGGSVTIVFTPQAPRACTIGDYVSAVPFGVGDLVKWDGTNPQLVLSNAVADVSGGLFSVHKVEMQHGATKGSVTHVIGRIKNPV